MRFEFTLASRAGNYFLTDLITNRTIYTYTHLTDNIMCIVAGNFRSFPSNGRGRPGDGLVWTRATTVAHFDGQLKGSSITSVIVAEPLPANNAAHDQILSTCLT